MAAVDPRDDPASVVAAQRVLLELWTILAGFADAMTIVGGSAPPLLTGDQPDDPYVGTLDVDLVIDPIGVPDDVYRTIAELLRERGYTQLDQPFRWLRSVIVDERSIDVEVDLLAPVTPRGGAGHRHERIGGEPLARRTEGAELVRTAFVDHEIAGAAAGRAPKPRRRPRRDPRRPCRSSRRSRWASATSRRTPTTSTTCSATWASRKWRPASSPSAGPIPSQRPTRILADKFSSIDAIGPASVALYRRVPLGSPEADQVQALAFARVDQLVRRLRAASSEG